MMCNAIFKIISVISLWPVHLSMILWIFFLPYSAQYSFQATVETMDSSERYESCHNDFSQSMETILA